MDQTTPTLEAARSIVLTCAVEDYSGLYEVLWDLNARFPDTSDDARLRVAQTAVEQLLREGLVEIFAARWAQDSFDAIPKEQALELLHDLTSWQPAEEYFCVGATSDGEELWRKSPFGVA